MIHGPSFVRASRTSRRSPRLMVACLLLFFGGLLVHLVGIRMESLALALFGLAGVVGAALLPVAVLVKRILAGWIAAGAAEDRLGTGRGL